MRRSLVWVFVAVSSIVALAFVVPLGFVVRTTAVDRAIDNARTDAAAVVPTLVSNPSREQIAATMASTEAGSAGRMSVALSDGSMIGPAATDLTRVDAALETGASSVGNVSGGREVVAAVVDERGQRSAIRVFVPSSELHKGQWTAWTALVVVAVTLVGLSVVVADRLAQTIVKPTQDLARAARKLGGGDLDVRVLPNGPPELVDLSQAFNDLAQRVSAMLHEERELVAELSHRLRTPLTALSMRLDDIDDVEIAQSIEADLDRLTNVVTTLIAEARRRPADRNKAASNAGAAVAHRVEFWAVLAQDQGRSWKFERSSGTSLVALDEAELLAALDVLIENVFAHTVEGIGLTVWVRQVSGSVRVGVRDEGPGFDPVTVRPGHSDSGSTGIGLSIAKRTAERANGRLEISHDGKGRTVVELVIPLIAGPTAL